VGKNKIEVKEIIMPPLTKPSAALAFMVLFFAATMGFRCFSRGTIIANPGEQPFSGQLA